MKRTVAKDFDLMKKRIKCIELRHYDENISNSIT